MGDNSIRVQEAPLVTGRMNKISNVTEDIFMPREHNHDTNTKVGLGMRILQTLEQVVLLQSQAQSPFHVLFELPSEVPLESPSKSKRERGCWSMLNHLHT